MSEWSSLHLKIISLDEVSKALQEITKKKWNISQGSVPDEFYDLLYDLKTHPEYFIFGKTQDEWISVLSNNLDKSSDFPAKLSEYLKCKVVVVLAQSVSDYYYFSVYDHGIKQREIEVCYSDDSGTMVNFGKPLAIEGPVPGLKMEFDGEVEYLFDFDAIVEYCSDLGLNLNYTDKEISWTICKSK